MSNTFGSVMRAVVVAAVAALGLPFAATAQDDYPNRPIEVVVPYSPGGSTDTAARIFLPALGEELGQPIAIQNRPGSAGNVGVGSVARAEPDGYTLTLTVNPPVTLNKFLFSDLPYDPATDFEPISIVAQTLLVLVAHPDFPADTVQELVDYARDNPGEVHFGSSGIGSAHHIAGAIMNKEAGLEMVHVPYQGGGPTMQDLVGGHIEIAFATLPSAIPHLEADAIKLIALAETERSDQMPDLPTVAETVPGVGMITWLGLLAPAGTPQDIVNRLHEASMAALAREDVQEGLANAGLVPVASSPEEFRELIRSDLAKFETLLPQIGIEPQ